MGQNLMQIAPNLQSNILKSHSRDHARLLFINFTFKQSRGKCLGQ